MTRRSGGADARLDRWLTEGLGVRPRALAVYRIVLSSYVLLFLLPNRGWLSDLPQALHNPPPGPFELLGTFPSKSWLALLDLAFAVSVVAVLIGYRTVASSMAMSVLWLAGAGLAYSIGRVDHGILLMILPAFAGLAGWGGAWSVDALAGRGQRPRLHWMTIYGLAVAVALAHAGLAKLQSGWLSPGRSATRDLLVRNNLIHGRDDLLAERLIDLGPGPLWELADILTVGFELGFLLALARPSLFRSWLALAALFHLAVLLALNIAFSANVVAYAAFLPWDRLVGPEGGRRLALRAPPRLLAPLLVVAGGVAVHLVGRPLGRVALSGVAAEPQVLVNRVTVVVAAAVGMTALVLKARHGSNARSASDR